MKALYSARWLPSAALLVAITGIILCTGCTRFAATHHKSRQALEEHSRALTTGVLEALQLQPPDRRDAFSEVALRLAREDQRIEGLPVESIPVAALAHPPAPEAERALARRLAEIEKLLARERASAGRLLDFGERFEAERNRTRAFWARWIGGSSLVVGGIIALCVFVPAAIPILGRLLAWLAGKVPSLAGFLGVVSTRAFDAIVKGIERTAPASEHRVRMDNTTASEGTDELHLNLSREMDAAHKALVRARKATLLS